MGGGGGGGERFVGEVSRQLFLGKWMKWRALGDISIRSGSMTILFFGVVVVGVVLFLIARFRSLSFVVC